MAMHSIGSMKIRWTPDYDKDGTTTRWPCFLVGPRGGEYILERSANYPNYCFVRNVKSYVAGGKVEGHKWFYVDAEAGTVAPVRKAEVK